MDLGALLRREAWGGSGAVLGASLGCLGQILIYVLPVMYAGVGSQARCGYGVEPYPAQRDLGFRVLRILASIIRPQPRGLIWADCGGLWLARSSTHPPFTNKPNPRRPYEFWVGPFFVAP